MFFKEIKKPKVGQTIFFVDESDDKQVILKKLFIAEVEVTQLLDTPITFDIGEKYFDASRQEYFQDSVIVKEMKNHIIIKTRCGEKIDLSVGEQCDVMNNVELRGEIFFNKNQANRYYKTQIKNAAALIARRKSLLGISPIAISSSTETTRI